MLSSPVLVLNRYFVPITVTNVKRAFVMLYGGVAKAVGGDYKTFDFESWADIAAVKDEDAIRTVSRIIRIPRVIMLIRYDRMPRKEAKFNRINIFKRDGGICQYCGEKFPRPDLTIDHLVPRSLGGKSAWDNVVCCCGDCNRRKGGRTPEEARMKVINKPKKPNWDPFSNLYVKAVRYKEWEPFLSFVDVSYWNVELEE
ncbi:MAG TPA: HNH endonuclease [Thermodesulfobacteriota bacterium]|jgi:5-methylcytosine-specific restriction endonuclease McrA